MTDVFVKTGRNTENEEVIGRICGPTTPGQPLFETGNIQLRDCTSMPIIKKVYIFAGKFVLSGAVLNYSQSLLIRRTKIEKVGGLVRCTRCLELELI